MYKLVPKRIIKRLADTEEAEELRMTKLTLELAKESDDELWRALLLLHLDDLNILNSKEGERIRKKLERNSWCMIRTIRYTNISMRRWSSMWNLTIC